MQTAAAVKPMGLVVEIPQGFQIDGHAFSFYLKANFVDFQLTPLNRIGMNEFFFPSERAASEATKIWYLLTGCERIGKLNSWQRWEQFR